MEKCKSQSPKNGPFRAFCQKRKQLHFQDGAHTGWWQHLQLSEEQIPAPVLSDTPVLHRPLAYPHPVLEAKAFASMF